MATLEPWFLGLLCGLGVLILILLITITILCARWSRKDRRRSKKKAQAAARHTSFRDIVAEQEKQEPSLPRAKNPNWSMKEAPISQNGTTELNGVRKISTGQQPFIVGSSLIQFSQELDKSGNSLLSQQPTSRKEFKPSENEEKMVQLGRIAPRPFIRTTSDLTGKRPTLVDKRTSEGHRRTTSAEVRKVSGIGRPTSADANWTIEEHTKPPSAASVPNGVDMQGVDDDTGWVSLRETEMQIWQKSAPPNGGRVNGGYRPYTLPKEDYDLAGAKWYESRADPLGDSHVQRLKEMFTPKRGEQSELNPTQIPRTRSAVDYRERKISGNQERSRRLSAGLEVPDIWHRIPEDPEDVRQDKLKRARKLGVPILPD